MGKTIYKLLDSQGRVQIPKELRGQGDMESGDIVKLSVKSGTVTVDKVDIVEVGRQDAETVEAFINAAVKGMGREKQINLASKILKLAGQEVEK